MQYLSCPRLHEGVIPIRDANLPSNRRLAWPLLVAFALLACLWVSPSAFADDEYDEYAEYDSVSEGYADEGYDDGADELVPEVVYEEAPAEAIESAEPAAEEAKQLDAEQAAKERAAAEAALKKRTEKLMSYLEKHHDALAEANDATKAAYRQTQASAQAVKKAKSKVGKQKKRVEKLEASYKQLCEKVAKGQRSGADLGKVLDAKTLNDLGSMMASLGSLSEQQVVLLKDIWAQNVKLQSLQRALDGKTAQAEADEAAYEQAKGASDEVDAKAAKRVGTLVGSVADDGARRALGDSIAESVFPEKPQITCPCPDTRIEDGFGYRDFDGAVHKGIDYAASEGQPYYAAADGIVIYATDDDGYNGGAGNWVVIAHGDGMISKYMHSQRTFVKVGDIVLQGQHIANTGQTGAAYGPHLHFQVEIDGEAVDPVLMMG